MPLASAQARDILLLFLQIATRSLLPQTPDEAYAAWASRATPSAVAELSRIVARLVPLLTAVRAVQRVKPGQDVARFIAAIETLQRLAGPPSGPVPRNGAARPPLHPTRQRPHERRPLSPSTDPARRYRGGGRRSGDRSGARRGPRQERFRLRTPEDTRHHVAGRATDARRGHQRAEERGG